MRLHESRQLAFRNAVWRRGEGSKRKAGGEAAISENISWACVIISWRQNKLTSMAALCQNMAALAKVNAEKPASCSKRNVYALVTSLSCEAVAWSFGEVERPGVRYYVGPKCGTRAETCVGGTAKSYRIKIKIKRKREISDLISAIYQCVHQGSACLCEFVCMRELFGILPKSSEKCRRRIQRRNIAGYAAIEGNINLITRADIFYCGK